MPTTGRLPDAGGLIEIASTAELAGADTLWVADRLLGRMPPGSDPPPPKLADGDYEALTCCAYLAAATLHCRIATLELVLAQRGVLQLAKTIASLDRMSSGRITLGVGVGTDTGQMEALGFDPGTRVARAEEIIAVLRDCWSGRPQAFAGREIVVPDGVVLEPSPAQAGGPPLIVCGTRPEELQRAAAHGDGWLSVAGAAGFDAAQLGDRVRTLETLRGRLGRTGPFSVVLELRGFQLDVLAQMAARARRCGVDELVVEVPWADAALAETTLDVARRAVT